MPFQLIPYRRATRLARMPWRKGFWLMMGNRHAEVAPLPGFSCESLAEAEAELRAVQNVPEAWREMATLPSVIFGLESLLDPPVPLRDEVDICGYLEPFPKTATGVSSDAPGRSPSGPSHAEGLERPLQCPLKPRVGEKPGLRQASGLEAQEEFQPPASGVCKVKVGRGEPQKEIEALHRLHRAHPGLRFRIDSNRCWELEEALRFVEACASLPVDFYEEPLQDASQLAELHARTGIPIGLDETLREPILTESDFSFVSALVVKPTLLGERAKIHSLMNFSQEKLKDGTRANCSSAREETEDFEVRAALDRPPPQLVISSCYETEVGIACLKLLARSLPHSTPAGLDTLKIFAQEDTHGGNDSMSTA